MLALKSIHLKNFKCYSDTTVSFAGKNNSPKHLIITYGANGSGKTTLLESIAFLRNSISTLLLQKKLQETMQNKNNSFTDLPFSAELILQSIETFLQKGSLASLLRNSNSSSTDENMELTFELFVNNKIATYSIIASKTEIIREKLEFPLVKNKVCCFDISKNNYIIHDNLINNDAFKKHVLTELDMLYNSHTFLSILNYEYQNNNADYSEKSINKNIITLISFINNISTDLHESAFYNSYNMPVSSQICSNLDKGTIKKADLNVLKHVESILPRVISPIFKDIRALWYETEDDEKNANKLKYSLYVKRRISKKDYVIPFSNESSGTKRMLKFIPYIMSAMNGNLVIIDEFGEDFHEKLARDLLVSISKVVTGQVILSTHMTGLLNKDEKSKLPEESFYFIKCDPEDDKLVSCLTDIENRLHKNLNYQDRYFYNPIFEKYLPDSNAQIGDQLAELLAIK